MKRVSYILLDFMNNLSATQRFPHAFSMFIHLYALGNPALVSSVQSLTCAACSALNVHNNSKRKAQGVLFHLYVQWCCWEAV